MPWALAPPCVSVVMCVAQTSALVQITRMILTNRLTPAAELAPMKILLQPGSVAFHAICRRCNGTGNGTKFVTPGSSMPRLRSRSLAALSDRICDFCAWLQPKHILAYSSPSIPATHTFLNMLYGFCSLLPALPAGHQVKYLVPAGCPLCIVLPASHPQNRLDGC